jgi:integrase
MSGPARPPSGHVFQRRPRPRPGLYAKYRLPDGRQVQKKLGPAWSERGRPPAGYLTERLAEDWLRSTLDEARRGTLPGLVRTGVTFADAASEYLRYGEQDRGCKPSTLRDCRSNLEAHLLPAFGNQALEAVTPGSIDVWRASLRGLSSRTKNKLLLVMHGVFRRAQHV